MPELYRENHQDDSDEAATIDCRFWREEISDRGEIDIGRLNDTADIKKGQNRSRGRRMGSGAGAVLSYHGPPVRRRRPPRGLLALVLANF